MKHKILIVLVVFCAMMPSAALADGPVRWVLKDYKTAMPFAGKGSEIGFEYQAINDTIDVLGLKKNEYGKLSDADRASAPGDLWGLRLFLNYGFSNSAALRSSFVYRGQDYGYDDLEMKTLDLSLTQRLLSPDYFKTVGLALDAGIRFNSATDMVYDNEEEINAIIRRVAPDSGVSIRISDRYIWFDQTVNGGQFSFGALRQDQTTPRVVVGDMQDFSTYARITGSWLWRWFSPNLFLEYGYTQIHSYLDTNIADFLPEELQELFTQRLVNVSQNLARSEHYLKSGVSMYIKLPFNVLLYLEYDHLKMYREDYLDYIDDNNIIKVDASYYLTPFLVLNLGGTYLERQLNGEIPFLYNQYTQTTFDHPYGYLYGGITYLFGSR